LLQQPVDQRGLAVVDVGDDGDVAQVHWGLCENGRILENSRAPKGPRFACGI
jgi:hypothetical protein